MSLKWKKRYQAAHPEPGGGAGNKVEAIAHLATQRADNPAPVKELEACVERERPDELSLTRTVDAPGSESFPKPKPELCRFIAHLLKFADWREDVLG